MRIEKGSIPDKEVPQWIQILREGGLTNEEIDTMLSHLNPVYGELKQEEFINRELQKMVREVETRRGSPLAEEEKTGLQEGIQSRFKK